MDENKLIDEYERLRIDTINEINHVQSLDREKQILLRIEDDPKARENYNIFRTQCEIDELLNKLVKFIKNHGSGLNDTYSLGLGITFDRLIDENEFVNFAMINIIPKISTEVVDNTDEEKMKEKYEKESEKAKVLYKCNIEELRAFLFYCYSITPIPIPKPDKSNTVDALNCFAAGVNPSVFANNAEEWFMEEKDYNNIFNNDLSEIIIKGTILGIPMATKASHNKPKKY